ncbi:MAG: hypothetical protein HY674_03915 [Chloroflexi bacterium]|nr:hypothetical protein [Chloroflexota bacterium]
MNSQRIQKIIALIKGPLEFSFDVMDIEEDLHVILAYYGIHDDYSLAQEFVIKRALLPLVSKDPEDRLAWGSSWPNRKRLDRVKVRGSPTKTRHAFMAGGSSACPSTPATTAPGKR